MIVAGDFNAGRAQPRWSALRQAIASWHGQAPFHDAISDVVRRRIARGAPLPGDVHAILRRAEDILSGEQENLITLTWTQDPANCPFGAGAFGSDLAALAQDSRPLAILLQTQKFRWVRLALTRLSKSPSGRRSHPSVRGLSP